VLYPVMHPVACKQENCGMCKAYNFHKILMMYPNVQSLDLSGIPCESYVNALKFSKIFLEKLVLGRVCDNLPVTVFPALEEVEFRSLWKYDFIFPFLKANPTIKSLVFGSVYDNPCLSDLIAIMIKIKNITKYEFKSKFPLPSKTFATTFIKKIKSAGVILSDYRLIKRNGESKLTIFIFPGIRKKRRTGTPK
jgi:hypothetical protein